MPAKNTKSNNKHVFVTVGTTEFDDLIATVVSEEVQTLLVHKGLVFGIFENLDVYVSFFQLL